MVRLLWTEITEHEGLRIWTSGLVCSKVGGRYGLRLLHTAL